MTWKAIYRTATGELVSTGTVVADPLPDGMSVINLGADRPTGEWDAQQRQFVAVQTVEVRHITKLAFRNRFSQSEKVAIEIGGLDNPAATMQERALSAALRASQADVAAASYIDLDRADTRTGVQQLEAAGLLAAGRAAEILDASIQDAERFYG